jgi:molybdenum cofactor synthesis domain-containing protein
LHAGKVANRDIDDHECVEIATGSPLPRTADAVVPVEDTKLTDNTVQILCEAEQGENVAFEGEDIKIGETVARVGETLTPGKLGAAAALGLAELKVYARPRVCIYSTGNEITPQGTKLKPGKVYDINSYTLASVIQMNGCIPERKRSVVDDIQKLLAALREAAKYDIAVFSGGSSVGTKDFFAEAVEKLGTVHFHGLKVKPGKPTLFGSIKGKPIFGMPGQPTSCLSNAYVFLTPTLRKMARLPPLEMKKVKARLTGAIRSDGEREVFYPIRLEDGKAVPAFKKGSNITSMAYSNGMIIIPIGTTKLEEGTEVEVLTFPLLP